MSFKILSFSLGQIVLLASIAIAQDTALTKNSSEDWSYHFQLTGISQTHQAFDVPYSGQNSLKPIFESKLSVTSTLFLGRRLWQGGEIYFDPELSGGAGLSQTLGVGGFPNGEVYRVGDPEPVVFLARLYLRQHFSLADDSEYSKPDQNQLSGYIPRSRITLTAGKFSLTDLFDDNAYSHDPRTQFMNWALMSHGAWDYAADTRGYTYGIAAELHMHDWSLNFAAALVPKEANGAQFDTHIADAHSFNLEFVKAYSLFGQTGNLHLVGFVNSANMGNYRKAIETPDSIPDVTKTRSYSTKYGFALAIEQPLSEDAGLFFRASWNDGKTETWVFTEIDRSVSLGVSSKASFIGRKEDVVGAALVLNGLSQDHRDYLAAGGYGFIIGDGKLNYSLEKIVEVFYNIQLASSLWLTLDNQFVLNPAYNHDRGPFVYVYAVRAHIEF
jgi:high affinity Mn2+ porin